MPEKVVATYHKNCVDGTTAAAVVLRKYPDAKLVPLSYGYTDADIAPALEGLTPDTLCFTVDCALGARELLAAGCAVVTLDHHITVKEELEQLARENPRYTYVFDNEKSGASISWSYFFKDEPMPDLVKYVEDADIWTWKYGDDTKAATSYLSMFRNHPQAVLEIIEGPAESILEKGRVIAQYVGKEIESQLAASVVPMRIGAHEVPAFNITEHRSAIGHILTEKEGKAVALYTIDGNEVKISFRSSEGQVPTARALAESLGGGGHEHASGAGVPLKDFIGMLVL